MLVRAEQRLLELGLSPEAAAEWCFWCLCQVIVHDVNELTEKLFPIVEAMQKHFSAGSGTYYSDSIFFLSVAMHRIMPKGRSASAVLQQHRLSFSSHRDVIWRYLKYKVNKLLGWTPRLLLLPAE